MLSRFHYYHEDVDADKCREFLENSSLNLVNTTLRRGRSSINTTDLEPAQEDKPDCTLSEPFWLEYLLIYWVFCFLCQEITQVK